MVKALTSPTAELGKQPWPGNQEGLASHSGLHAQDLVLPVTTPLAHLPVTYYQEMGSFAYVFFEGHPEVPAEAHAFFLEIIMKVGMHGVCEKGVKNGVEGLG